MQDWKRDAKDKLRDYPLQLNACKTLPEEIRALADVGSLKGVATDNIRVRGGENGNEDRILSALVKAEELKKALARAKVYVRLVEQALNAIDPAARMALEKYYIHPTKGKLEDLQAALQLQDQRSVYKALDRALRDFTLAYYGVLS